MAFGTNILVILVILSWVLAIEANHKNQANRHASEDTQDARSASWNSKHDLSDSNMNDRRMH